MLHVMQPVRAVTAIVDLNQRTFAFKANSWRRFRRTWWKIAAATFGVIVSPFPWGEAPRRKSKLR